MMVLKRISLSTCASSSRRSRQWYLSAQRFSVDVATPVASDTRSKDSRSRQYSSVRLDFSSDNLASSSKLLPLAHFFQATHLFLASMMVDRCSIARVLFTTSVWSVSFIRS